MKNKKIKIICFLIILIIIIMGICINDQKVYGEISNLIDKDEIDVLSLTSYPDIKMEM